jgi:hypothetical protein
MASCMRDCIVRSFPPHHEPQAAVQPNGRLAPGVMAPFAIAVVMSSVIIILSVAIIIHHITVIATRSGDGAK